MISLFSFFFSLHSTEVNRDQYINKSGSQSRAELLNYLCMTIHGFGELFWISTEGLRRGRAKSGLLVGWGGVCVSRFNFLNIFVNKFHTLV